MYLKVIGENSNKNKMKKYLSVLILVLLFGSCQKVKDILPKKNLLSFEFENSYGGDSGNVPESIIQTNDGGILLSGYSSSSGNTGTKASGSSGNRDCWVVKVDAKGTQLWDKTYSFYPYKDGDSYLKKVIQTKDNGFLIGGESSWAAELMKITSSGELLWSFNNDYDDAYDLDFSDVLELEDGNILLIGVTSNFFGQNESNVFIKLSPSGKRIWSQKYTGRGKLYSTIAFELGLGKVQCFSNTTEINDDNVKSFSFQIESNGTISNQNEILNSTQIIDVVQTSKNIFTLMLYSLGKQSEDLYNYKFLTYDNNLSKVISEKSLSVKSRDFIKIRQTDSNKIVVAGNHYNGYDSDVLISSYDANFNLLSEDFYGGDNNDYIKDILVRQNKCSVLSQSFSKQNTGNKKSKLYGECDFWLLKFNY